MLLMGHLILMVGVLFVLIAYNDCKAIGATELQSLLNELGLDDYECKCEGVGCIWHCQEVVRRSC